MDKILSFGVLIIDFRHENNYLWSNWDWIIKNDNWYYVIFFYVLRYNVYQMIIISSCFIFVVYPFMNSLHIIVFNHVLLYIDIIVDRVRLDYAENRLDCKLVDIAIDKLNYKWQLNQSHSQQYKTERATILWLKWLCRTLQGLNSRSMNDDPTMIWNQKVDKNFDIHRCDIWLVLICHKILIMIM